MYKFIQSVMYVFFGSLLSFSVLAAPTNFSYTSVGVGLGKQSLKDSIIFAGEIYDEFGLFGIGGSYQFADDLLFVEMTSQAASNSGPNTELTSSVVSFGLGIVQAINNSIDVNASINSLSAKVEGCAGALCIKDDDTGTAFGLGLDAWFNDAKTIAGHLSFTSVKYSNDPDSTTSTGLGLSTYINNNHELGLYFSSSDSSSSSALTYDYHFD